MRVEPFGSALPVYSGLACARLVTQVHQGEVVDPEPSAAAGACPQACNHQACMRIRGPSGDQGQREAVDDEPYQEAGASCLVVVEDEILEEASAVGVAVVVVAAVAVAAVVVDLHWHLVVTCVYAKSELLVELQEEVHRVASAFGKCLGAEELVGEEVECWHLE